MLRKRIYIDDYPEMITPTLPTHIGKTPSELSLTYANAYVQTSVEALRQNPICTADMTPAPLFYTPPPLDKLQPTFEVTHSCRNIRPLFEWARTRSVHHDYGHHH
jgi:hypothetical protein